AAPTRPQAIVLRLVYHFVHGHHRPLHESVLRKAGNLIGIFRKLLLAVLHALHFAMLHTGLGGQRLLSTFLAQWTVGSRLVIGRTNSQASPETWPIVVPERHTGCAIQHSHSIFHAHTHGHTRAAGQRSNG